MSPTTRKSIWAVVAGVLFIIVVTTLVDILLHVVGFFPPMENAINDLQATVATAYRIPISVFGAYLTAKMAPQSPMKHALILGGVGTVLGVVGLIATIDKHLGPQWYPIALAVLALPQCWLGGQLFVRRSAA